MKKIAHEGDDLPASLPAQLDRRLFGRGSSENRNFGAFGGESPCRYMVRNTEPSPFTGKTRTTNLPATLQDDVLQVSVGFGAISLAIDGKSGNLTDGRMEYRRQE